MRSSLLIHDDEEDDDDALPGVRDRRTSGVYIEGDSGKGDSNVTLTPPSSLMRRRASSINRSNFAPSTALHSLLLSEQRRSSVNKGGSGTNLARNLSTAFLSMLTGGGTKNRKRPSTRMDAAALTELEPMLKKIDDASLKVLKNQKDSVEEYVTVHSIMGLELTVRDMDDSESDDSEDREADGKEGVRSKMPKRRKRKLSERVTSKMGLFLTLFATLLYQMNQYVVAPTSGQYSDQLGMSPSLSGLIIGLSPFAALLSALVFSVWTNYSFKQPLIVCLFLLGTGNLLYALALQFNSPKLIFLGRLLTGLGVPRGIARRYIADHVSLADRTEASSQFVTAGAMGLAFGPLLSSIVSMSGYSFIYKWNEVTIVQYELVTAPGWLMAIMFYATLIVLIFFFEEPYIEQQPPPPPISPDPGPANRKRGSSFMGRRPDSSFLVSSQHSMDGNRNKSGSMHGSMHGSTHGGSMHGADGSRRGKKTSGSGFGGTNAGSNGSFNFMGGLFAAASNKESPLTPRGLGQIATSMASSFGMGKGGPSETRLNTPRNQNTSLLASSSSKSNQSGQGRYGTNYGPVPTSDTRETANWSTKTGSDRTDSLTNSERLSLFGKPNASASASANASANASATASATASAHTPRGEGEGEGERAREMPRVLSLDDIAKMARASERSIASSYSPESSSRSVAELTGAAQQILLSSQHFPRHDAIAPTFSVDETASQATVKFAENNELERGMSDVHSHHSGYTNHTIHSQASSERRQGTSHQFLTSGVQYDQVLADFGGDIQSYHDQENAYYESVYDEEDGDCIGWLCWLCCPSWMCWCCNVLGDEVVVILFIYLINKVGQEMVVSSVPSVAMELFGWDSQLAGFFMATMGGLVLPFNILVSKLAKEVEDRTMMTYLNYLSVASVVFILRMPFIEYSATQYVCGSVMIFVFLNALEGVIMSLLSKLVSPELARGTWNSGLLATEAGTFGRVLGDMAITYYSGEAPKDDLINVLYSPVAVGMVVVVVLCARYFERMEV